MAEKLSKLLLHALITMVILWVVRLVFIVEYVPFDLLTVNRQALPLAAYNVFRFDFQVASYLLILPTLLVFAVLLWRNQGFERFLRRFSVWYFVVFDILILIISIIDLGFYANFNSHINLTIFDFFNEGPIGLLQTIWEEYHCMLYLLLLCLAAIVLKILSERVERLHISHAVMPKPWSIAVLIGYLTLLTFGLRGSFSRFPLQIEDTFVSDNKLINDMVPNGLYMLKTACKEKKNAFKIETPDALLARYRFTDIQQALDIYTDKRVRLQANDTLKALREALFAKAPDTLTHPLPNVVIIYSESWSNYLINLDDAKGSLLLGMQRHFKEDLLFRNFQSVQNGTVASIENLTVSTPYPRFFASAFRLRLLPTSIALPFNASGYTTEFLSGMDTAWENCAEALRHQGFQTIYDKFSILKDYPHAEANSVGVFDEYLLTAILDRLNKKAAKPRLMIAMTTTNHPPFEYPKSLSLSPLPSRFYTNPCFAEKDSAVLNKYITGFRYYNKVLSAFLDSFKASPAARNTILIVTGDHNVRSILDPSFIGKRWTHSVPLYVYLPPSLRHPDYRRMTNRWGCHDDILATVAPFALHHTHYMKLGNNLFDRNLPDSCFYSYNVEQLLADKNGYKTAEKRLAARNLLREIYFNLCFRKP